MEIGLNIVDELKINIGDSIENIKKSLEDRNIEYKIHDVKGKSDKIKTNIMYIQEQGVEINIEDDSINFIKSSNDKLNYIFAIEEGNSINMLSQIINNVSSAFSIDKKDITVNEFDGNNLRTIITIKIGSKALKMSLMLGFNNKVYINTIRLLKDSN